MAAIVPSSRKEIAGAIIAVHDAHLLGRRRRVCQPADRRASVSCSAPRPRRSLSPIWRVPADQQASAGGLRVSAFGSAASRRANRRTARRSWRRCVIGFGQQHAGGGRVLDLLHHEGTFPERIRPAPARALRAPARACRGRRDRPQNSTVRSVSISAEVGSRRRMPAASAPPSTMRTRWVSREAPPWMR